MPSGSMKIWIADASRILEESHPCEAQRVGQMAVGLLSEVLKKQEKLEATIAELKKEALMGKLGKVGEAIRDEVEARRLRRPKVWRDGESFPSEEGVIEIQDNDRDLYCFVGDGKWGRLSADGKSFNGHYDMSWLVEEYGPIVEVGDGVEKIRWFSGEVKEGFRLPEWTHFIEDAEGDEWMMVSGDGKYWETHVRDHDDIKEDGHWTPYKIAQMAGSVMIVPRVEKTPDNLTFKKGEAEPHESIAYVRSERTQWYYQKDEEGLWYAPGVPREMKEQHGKSAVTWEELLNHAEVLTEYRR